NFSTSKHTHKKKTHIIVKSIHSSLRSESKIHRYSNRTIIINGKSVCGFFLLQYKNSSYKISI
ncbi:hypothetical protein FWK35_00008443, partial [Aphis craccivora]